MNSGAQPPARRLRSLAERATHLSRSLSSRRRPSWPAPVVAGAQPDADRCRGRQFQRAPTPFVTSARKPKAVWTVPRGGHTRGLAALARDSSATWSASSTRRCGEAAGGARPPPLTAPRTSSYRRRMTSAEPMRVLVAGAGVAGLETVLALQALAGDRTAIELLAPDRHFTYRPLAVAEPFAPGSVQRFPIAAIAADRAVPLVRDAVAQVHADDRVVETQDGSRLEYDALVARARLAPDRGGAGRAHLPRAPGRRARGRRGRRAARGHDPPRGVRRAGRHHLGAAAVRARAAGRDRRARRRRGRRAVARHARAHPARGLRRGGRRRRDEPARGAGHHAADRRDRRRLRRGPAVDGARRVDRRRPGDRPAAPRRPAAARRALRPARLHPGRRVHARARARRRSRRRRRRRRTASSRAGSPPSRPTWPPACWPPPPGRP